MDDIMLKFQNPVYVTYKTRASEQSSLNKANFDKKNDNTTNLIGFEDYNKRQHTRYRTTTNLLDEE